jgi:hypothetical protein
MSNQYSNSKIYKIWSPQTDLIYIGSTTQILCKRLADHKRNYDSYINKKQNSFYTSSYELLKYDDYKIELIEEVNCQSKIQLNRREGILQREYRNICVNMLIAGRTKEEYRQDNHETILNKRKEYYDTKHKEKEIEYSRNYRLNNKEKIKEKNEKSYNCICGSIIKYGYKYEHFRTQKHQSYLEDSLFHFLDL